MISKIARLGLAVVFLVHACNLPQAHTLDILPVVNERRADQIPSAVDMRVRDQNRVGKLPETRPIDRRLYSQPGEPIVLAPWRRPKATKLPGVGHSKGRSTRTPGKAGGRKMPEVHRPVGLNSRIGLLMSRYEDIAGTRLRVTSRGRTSAGQARAILRNLQTYGTRYVQSQYRHSQAIREVMRAYKPNRRRPRKALKAMTRVIQNQVARGVYISAHMLGKAIDVRSRGRDGARLSVLRMAARSVGARVSVERNHYHVQLL